MCMYCDVRMPDGCGFELSSKRKDFELMLCPNGNTRVIYDDCKGNVYRDDFYFNYCPMCGKPLNDNDNDEVQQFYIIEEYGEYVAFDNEKQAREYAEQVATKFGVCDLIMTTAYLRISCEVRCCWDDE